MNTITAHLFLAEFVVVVSQLPFLAFLFLEMNK